MFYFGKEPWHGIGTKLNNPATSREAIHAAGLNYEIRLDPVYVPNRGSYTGSRKFYATHRTNSPDVMGIVSRSYKIIQNWQAFEFFDSIVGQKLAIYHTAGALGIGERIWILAKIPGDIIVKGEDKVEKYLCLTNSHDGKHTLKVYFTPIRVVCQNTLNASLKNTAEGVSIKHSGQIQSKVEEAKRILGISYSFYKEFESLANVLANKSLNVEDAENYFRRVLFQKDEDLKSANAKNKLSKVLWLFDEGKGNKITSIRHTAWTAYNAVTEMVDHCTNVKNIKKDPTNRLKNIWFGSGANLKMRALNEIKTLVAN